MDNKSRLEKRMIIMLVTVIGSLIMITGIIFFINKDNSLQVGSIKEQTKYNSEKKIEKALKSIKSNSHKASVITDINTPEKEVAITFDGLTDMATMQKLLDLLETHEMKGTFFVPGIGAAEDPDTVQAIVKAKQEIGSYSLSGKKHMEKLTVEELIEDYCRTNVILNGLIGKEPKLLKCNVTDYTEDVLKAAYVSNVKSVVSSNRFLNYQSFSSYEMALGYVRKLAPGSIISIKVEGYLGAEEYEPQKEEKPAVDKQASIEKIEKTEVLDEKEQLVQVVGWLLQALQETNHIPEFVKDFPSLQKDKLVTAPQTEKKQDNEENKGRKTVKYTRINTRNNISEIVPKPLKELSEKSENTIEFKRLRNENKGKLAEEIHTVYTTEQAATYIFYGISNKTVLNDVLDKLLSFNAKATFFVTAKEIAAYPDRISKMIDQGHEIGIAVLSSKTSDYYTVCNEIYTAKQYLKDQFNMDTSLVKQPWGKIQDETKEAVSSMGCRLITHDTTVVQTKDEYASSADSVMDSLFEKNTYALKRGQIVFFRMDYYKGSNSLLGELIEEITEQKINNITYTADISEKNPKNGSEYTIKGVNALLNNKEKIYSYPLELEQILPEVRYSINSGHLAQMSSEDVFQKISAKYIGNPAVKTIEQLPGFTEEEISKIDKIGKIKTADGKKEIFLTFDDWGTDTAINHLLYILRKHQVKATFFIRTNHVSSNPNLLRTIAEEGHDIASHTDSHMELAQYVEQTGEYVSITPQEKVRFQEDIIKSYQVLQSVIGDMKNENGSPVLTTMFRPPTLAVSRIGLETVLDSGYEYIVSGDFSTHDYEAANKEELKATIINGILLDGGARRTVGNGSILVMHMSDDSKYTAQALDEFLTENQMKEASERYTFARLSDYLKK